MILARPRFGLPAALLKHGIVLVLGIGAIWVEATALPPVSQQPVAWLAISIVIGVVAAIIARGLIGSVFLVSGMILGVLGLLMSQYVATADAAARLGQDGWLYAALILAALEAYLIVLLILIRFRRA